MSKEKRTANPDRAIRDGGLASLEAVSQKGLEAWGRSLIGGLFDDKAEAKTVSRRFVRAAKTHGWSIREAHRRAILLFLDADAGTR